LTTSGGVYGGIDQDVDVGEILQQHPELMSGLAEYMRWRDQLLMSIAKEDEQSPIAHEASGALAELRDKQTDGSATKAGSNQ